MFSRLWWKGLFVEPKMVQIKIPEVSLVSLFCNKNKETFGTLIFQTIDWLITLVSCEKLLVNETHCEK